MYTFIQYSYETNLTFSCTITFRDPTILYHGKHEEKELNVQCKTLKCMPVYRLRICLCLHYCHI